MLILSFRSFAALAGILLLGLSAPLHALDACPQILLHPESALGLGESLSVQESGMSSPALVMGGATLSFSAPQILLDKSTPEARFVSALWKESKESKGAPGQLAHQRNVLIVGKDYAVIVDYLYGAKDQPELELSRRQSFPGHLLTTDAGGGQLPLDAFGPTPETGMFFRIQPLDPAIVSAITSPSAGVQFTSKMKLPAPVTTLMLVWNGEKAPVVESVKAVNPMVVKLRITFPDGRVDELALAWEARSLHIGKSEFKGWAACLSHRPAGEQSLEIN